MHPIEESHPAAGFLKVTAMGSAADHQAAHRHPPQRDFEAVVASSLTIALHRLEKAVVPQLPWDFPDRGFRRLDIPCLCLGGIDLVSMKDYRVAQGTEGRYEGLRIPLHPTPSREGVVKQMDCSGGFSHAGSAYPFAGADDRKKAGDKSLASGFGRRHTCRDRMVDFLLKIWGLTRPYRGRLMLGVITGVVGGLIEPLMIVTIVFVFGLIFPDANTGSSLLKPDSFQRPAAFVESLSQPNSPPSRFIWDQMPPADHQALTN